LIAHNKKGRLGAGLFRRAKLAMIG
jgi:hypothetical protein